jgi:tetraacyldisaccharide-1-P 4'-kinase
VPSGPVYAIAGIASAAGFFEPLRTRGLVIAGTRAFRDHHRFSQGDVDDLFAAARAANAAAVLTTEKDYVRLLRFRPFPLPVGFVPLTITPEPLAGFTAWLVAGLRAARDAPGD